jgi:hypothetical protein
VKGVPCDRPCRRQQLSPPLRAHCRAKPSAVSGEGGADVGAAPFATDSNARRRGMVAAGAGEGESEGDDGAPSHVPCPITTYVVAVWEVGAGSPPPTAFNHSGSTQVVRRGLRDNVQYTVRVCAVNGVGPGPWSPWSPPVSTTKRFLGGTPLWAVGVSAGVVVALFALLKACDCGFRCRRRRVCRWVTVCCCTKLRRLPTLPRTPGDAAGDYRAVESPAHDDHESFVPNTQYVVLSPARLAASAVFACVPFGSSCNDPVVLNLCSAESWHLGFVCKSRAILCRTDSHCAQQLGDLPIVRGWVSERTLD